MNIKLSEHFTYSKLIIFALPTIIMSILNQTYNIVDGLFVSNFINTTAFAAVNFVWPIVMIFNTIGFIFSSGGSALIAKILGEKGKEEASEVFSMLVYVAVIFGIIVTILGIVLLKPILIHFGTKDLLFEDCLIYGYLLLSGVTFFVLQVIFQTLLIVDEKPHFGLFVTTLSGGINIILDYVFIVLFKLEIIGTGLATVIGQIIGCFIPLFYFIFSKNSNLKLKKAKFNMKNTIKIFANGFSEFLSISSISIVNMLYNFQMLKIIGENGVVAYGVIDYINFIFLSVFIGYFIGTCPIISYNYGAKNNSELKNVFLKNIKIIAISSIILTILSNIFARQLVSIFVKNNESLLNITTNGFKIYSLSFLIIGFNVYFSSFFTALNNGLISAFISTYRTLICQCLSIIILPIFFGITGVWFAVVVSELISLMLSTFLLFKFRKEYDYI